MSSLTKIRVVSRFPRFYRAFASSEKEEESPWYRDNAPGPYPKTEEEKCAAAKKYGLLREEYEPYPDDGDGFGDYPKVEHVNVDLKDPDLLWTDKHFRRNHGDVVPINFLAYLPGRARYHKPRHSLLHYLLGFLALPGTIALTLYLFQDYKVHHDVLEKQLYIPGVTYYTFDFDDDDKDLQKHH